MKENTDYELVPVEDDKWAVRFLTGPYTEMVVKYDAIKVVYGLTFRNVDDYNGIQLSNGRRPTAYINNNNIKMVCYKEENYGYRHIIFSEWIDHYKKKIRMLWNF